MAFPRRSKEKDSRQRVTYIRVRVHRSENHKLRYVKAIIKVLYGLYFTCVLTPCYTEQSYCTHALSCKGEVPTAGHAQSVYGTWSHFARQNCGLTFYLTFSVAISYNFKTIKHAKETVKKSLIAYADLAHRSLIT